MPVTILKLDREKSLSAKADSDGQARPKDPLTREVEAGAEAGAETVKNEGDLGPEKVYLTTRAANEGAAATVREEARKGYDLLFVGMEKSHDVSGNISQDIGELVCGFGGPSALFSFAGDKAVPRLSQRTPILLPVNGTPASRRAAEVGFALARPTGAPVRALFVSQTDGWHRTLPREEGVLKDIVELAERYDVNLATLISKLSGPADAILDEAGRGYGMIVMGANPGWAKNCSSATRQAGCSGNGKAPYFYWPPLRCNAITR